MYMRAASECGFTVPKICLFACLFVCFFRVVCSVNRPLSDCEAGVNMMWTLSDTLLACFHSEKPKYLLKEQ